MEKIVAKGNFYSKISRWSRIFYCSPSLPSSDNFRSGNIASMENMDWANLDSQFLCSVFDYFTFEELKTISLVCQNWNKEIAFLWRDRMKLDFQQFFNDRNTLQANIQVLKNSNRIYANLRIEDNTFFEDTEAVFKAIPLRKNYKTKYVRSLKLKGFNIVQIEQIFNWMGESLERLNISNMSDEQALALNEQELAAINTNDQYFRIFAKLGMLLIETISDDFKGFYKYFVNVTYLYLHDITYDHFQELIKCCSNVRRLHLGVVKKPTSFHNSDVDILQSLRHLQEIVLIHQYDRNSKEFSELIAKTLCDPNIDHFFPLRVFHLEYSRSRIIDAENIKKLIRKFTHLEDILVRAYYDDITVLEPIWNIKDIKAIRGTICINVFKDMPTFDFSPRLSLTTIEIRGISTNLNWNTIKKLFQCLPNLETLHLEVVYGDLSLVFEQLSLLNNLKTLELFEVIDNGSGNTDRSKVHCLKSLENLQVNNPYSQYYKLELPNLKKIILKDEFESSLTGKCLLSIITTSKNLEYLDIGSHYFPQLLNLQKLKVLFLSFEEVEDIFICVKSFLRSTHKITSINLRYNFKKINQSDFDKKITKLSKFADEFSIVSEKSEYLFIKNVSKIKVHLSKY